MRNGAGETTPASKTPFWNSVRSHESGGIPLGEDGQIKTGRTILNPMLPSAGTGCGAPSGAAHPPPLFPSGLGVLSDSG